MACAFFSPYPIGFWVATFGFGGYLAALGGRAVAARCARTAVLTAAA
jgi:zinc/manganese transport system permease protein